MLLPIIDLNTWWTSIILFIIGYFVGCFILSRIYISFFKKGDTSTIDKHSGETYKQQSFGGSSSILALGLKVGITQIVFDIAKPIIFTAAVYVPLQKFVPAFANSLLICGITGVLVGHIFPIFWKFKGGDGVAVSLGSLFVVNWIAAISAWLVWAAILAFYKNQVTATWWGVLVGVSINSIPQLITWGAFTYYAVDMIYWCWMMWVFWIIVSLAQLFRKGLKYFWLSISFNLQVNIKTYVVDYVIKGTKKIFRIEDEEGSDQHQDELDQKPKDDKTG